MGRSSHVQQSPKKSKRIAKRSEKKQLPRLSAHEVNSPLRVSVIDNVSLLRAMYRQARQELDRPHSAPVSKRCFRRCADAVRRSSRDVVHQHRIVLELQDSVGVTKASKQIEFEQSLRCVSPTDATAKDSIAARQVGMALLNLEMPKDFRELGIAIRRLQMITALCKDDKFTVAELHTTCVKLLQKSRDLAARLEATRGCNDHARRLQEEIVNVVEVLRKHATFCNGGLALRWDDVALGTVLSSHIKDVGSNGSQDEKTDTMSNDFSAPCQNEGLGIIISPCLSDLPITWNADGEEKAEESSAHGETNDQLDAEAANDVSEFRSSDQVPRIMFAPCPPVSPSNTPSSNSRLTPCPPVSPSNTPSLNSRLKYARHGMSRDMSRDMVRMPRSISRVSRDIAQLSRELGPLALSLAMDNHLPCWVDRLPPLAATSKPGASPSPWQSSIKWQGTHVLPPLSPFSARLSSGECATDCALKENRHPNASPRLAFICHG